MSLTMGAWGTRNFESDTALDWLAEFEATPTVTFLQQTIELILEAEFLDADHATEALAAIEVVAAIRNQPSIDFPEIGIEDLTYLSPEVNPDLIEKSQQAIHRILQDGNNELYSLWADTKDLNNWIAVQNDLVKRLTA